MKMTSRILLLTTLIALLPIYYVLAEETAETDEDQFIEALENVTPESLMQSGDFTPATSGTAPLILNNKEESQSNWRDYLTLCAPDVIIIIGGIVGIETGLHLWRQRKKKINNNLKK